MADSNYAFAPRVLGILLSHLGRHEEARASIRRARELDPLSAMNRALSSQIDFAAGDADGAVRYAREAIIIDPEFWIGHLQLAQAYVELQATAAHSNLLPRQAGSAAETARHSPCEAICLLVLPIRPKPLPFSKRSSPSLAIGTYPHMRWL